MVISDILIGSTLILALSSGVQTFRLSNSNHQIETHKTEIKLLETVISNYEADQEILRGVIERMNAAADKIKIDYDKRLEEAENRDPSVVIKYVDRFITPDVNITRGNCEDVSNLLNNLDGVTL